VPAGKYLCKVHVKWKKAEKGYKLKCIEEVELRAK
jgi:hypothetical protein